MTTIRMNDPADLEDVNPIESQRYPGFYHYPEEPRLLVSKDAVIVNSLNGKIIGGGSTPDKRGGRTISFSFKGTIKTRYLHRIVARTFCGRPTRHLDKAFSELEVNHIDGIRSNNTHGNLEWVTGTENALHCHLSGGHPLDTPVLALSLRDGSITQFPNAKQCADRFGVHRATFFKHLKSGDSGKAEKNRHVFKYDDETEWNVHPENQRYVLGSSKALGAVVVYDGQRHIVFDSMVKACKHYGLPITRVWKSLKNTRKFQNAEFTITFLVDGPPHKKL